MGRQDYITDLNETTNPAFQDLEFKNEFYTHTDLAIQKIAGNIGVNYRPAPNVKFDIAGGFMDNTALYGSSVLSTTQYQTPPYSELSASNIDGKFILNAKVGYRLNTNINIFASARNAFNNDGREYFGTDKIGAIYLAGIRFNL